jgi:Family of unknown function (DUF6069)
MTSTTQVPVRARRHGLAATASAIATAAVAGIVACLIIATIAHAVGAPGDFSPLKFPSYTFLVLLGVIAGAVGWNIVLRLSTDPQRLLARLVPAVLVVSFVPDVLIGVSKSMTGTTWGAVFALMVMHVAVAAVAVGSYRFFLPAAGAGGARPATARG